ncbi:MAG: ADP-ribosylglycohydrolase family protein [Nitrospinae bacterium]|nr:ADP-ribosylglycohydrolase family protein [Nitrospinota bacterium]
MEIPKDKVIGSWFGMAVGDAMGTGVRGLKPQTIAQCFKGMDGYKDVRPFIGKGVKGYRMQGLYSSHTQRALVVCESLLRNKKLNLDDLIQTLVQMAGGGPEKGFGVFRHSEGCFRKTVEEFRHRRDPRLAELNTAFCSYNSMAVPIALYFRTKQTAMMNACLEAGLLMSRNPWEMAGIALTGYFVTRLLGIEVEDAESGDLQAEIIFSEAAAFCEEAETGYKKNHPGWWGEYGEENGRAMSRTFHSLNKIFRELDEEKQMDWICKNAAAYFKTGIQHPSQGYVLTLIPLAAIIVLTQGRNFEQSLTRAINLGREADKLGCLVGAWAGALYGYSRIPDRLKSGLVNSKEIRNRGEALANRKALKGFKDLPEMESGLTFKEMEDSRKFPFTKTRKTGPLGSGSKEVFEDEDSNGSLANLKEDAYGWRKYQRDKSKQKRDRRRNLGKK